MISSLIIDKIIKLKKIMSQKLYLSILKIGSILSLIVVFFVFKGLLFPFITSKQISFNIIIEVLSIFWIAFVLKYPEYKPKKSFITYGLIAFFSVLTLSCWTGVDFNLSFWGDIERMLGVFHLLHFLAFYIILITTFRKQKDWNMLLISSIVVAIFESFYAISNHIYHGTIGNTAYVSGYLIFNIYFSVLLFFKYKKNKLKWLFLIPILIMLLAFEKADTTGAFVGLGFSVIMVFLLYGLLIKNRKVKAFTIFAFVFISIFSGVLLANKNSDFVKKIPVLKNVRELSLQKNTFQTRLISWKAGIRDLKNHPMLGSGHGNFAIIFDKYFDPKFYDYTRSETYFDRAHNNIIDIISTSGILGFVSYMSIFIAVAFYLITSYRKKKIDLHEFVIISCLLIAYFVQNLAVFDSLVTYISLMIILAYIFWLSNLGEEKIFESIGKKVKTTKEHLINDRYFENKEIYTLGLSALIIFTIMYQYNIKPLQMLTETINGQRAFAQGQINETVDIYRNALSKNTVLDRDSRTSLIRLFVGNSSILQKMNKEKTKETLNYCIEMAEANVKYNKQDSMNQMILGQILNVAANFNRDNTDKFLFYSDRAFVAIDKAIEATPGRIPVYFQKAQFYMTRGEQDKAIETLKYAASLSDTYYDSYCHLGRTYLYAKNEEEAYKSLDQCIDLGGVNMISPAGLVKVLINKYVGLKDEDKVIKLYVRLTSLEKSNAKNWIILAKLYADQGEKEKAIRAVNKAMKLDKSIKSYAEEFIESLE